MKQPGEGWRKSHAGVRGRLCKVCVRKFNFCAACYVSLQSLLAQHKDFGAAFKPLQKKLSDLQERVQTENGLQQDLPRKQAQLSRLQVRAWWGPSGPAQGLCCAQKQLPSSRQSLSPELRPSSEFLLIYLVASGLQETFSTCRRLIPEPSKVVFTL